ncbi:MAG: hypothetical protein V1875_02640 [Candidatus Altiarchaeota archaeon]
MAKLSCVLDASGINRSSLDFTRGGYGIPSSVLSELKDERVRSRVEDSIRVGDVTVVAPGGDSLEKASATAKETGDISSLSRPDLDVLAAAIEHGLTIVSDDYAIQNTAARLGIRVEATSQKAISRQLTWVWSCEGCGRKMEGPGACGVCGHKARKRPA